jgi:hypothetical protein
LILELIEIIILEPLLMPWLAFWPYSGF